MMAGLKRVKSLYNVSLLGEQHVKQIIKWIKKLFTGPRWNLTVSYNTTWGDKDDKSYTVKKFKKLSDKQFYFFIIETEDGVDTSMRIISEDTAKGLKEFAKKR